MTSLKFYSLLAVLELVGLFVLIWFRVLSDPLAVVFTVLVAIVLFDMMRGSLCAIARTLSQLIPKAGCRK